MGDNYEKMETKELEMLLLTLKEELADIERMKNAVLGQTGHHVPGRSVKEFAQNIDKVNTKIHNVEKILHERWYQQSLNQ